MLTQDIHKSYQKATQWAGGNQNFNSNYQIGRVLKVRLKFLSTDNDDDNNNDDEGYDNSSLNIYVPAN